jgi:hypothetical protein
MIPMRDGVRLQTVIFIPGGTSQTLPILLTRTPYGVPADARPLMGEWYAPLRAAGYIFVMQNLRGRFASEGAFVMDRPPRAGNEPNAIDETTDAYDTIEWLVQHVPNNNGRVGLIGGSYSAWTATLALLEPHAALKVVSEAASPADQFLGDDLHHNGAFRLDYGFEFSTYLELSKERNTPFEFDRGDTYEWFLQLGPLSRVNERYLHGSLPSWNGLVAHPNLDEYWLKKSLASHLTRTTVPTLNVAGSWDQEDYYGPLKIYELLERQDSAGINNLVIGPWNHDGWSGPGRKLLDINFGSDTGVYYREHVQARWLARWLHDEPGETTPEAHVFVSGINRWESFDRWPPTDRVKPTKLYLRAEGKLGFDPPQETGRSAFDQYVSDPQNPVPYRPRPIRPIFEDHDAWSTWQLVDQRFVDHRPDVLSWETDVLDRDVVVVGNIVAELFASTSGSDSDWIVKLVDVYPQNLTHHSSPEGQADSQAGESAPDLRGYQLMIAGEVMRGRFRASFARPEPLVPGKVSRYEFSLREHAHAFLKGHRIMVQIQSSWFPLIDRNPQKFVPNIFAAAPSDFVKATQRICRSREAASAIVLPVILP